MRAWVRAADLARTKTLQGGLVARSAPGLPFLLREGMEVAFVPPQHDAPRRARVMSVQDEGRGALVRFDVVESIEDAERLVGCSVLVRRDEVPEAGRAAEPEGLAGFELRDGRSGFSGVVEDVIEHPGQTLLVVGRADGGSAVLVPFVDAFVRGVDEGARRIDVELPDGLLDL